MISVTTAIKDMYPYEGPRNNDLSSICLRGTHMHNVIQCALYGTYLPEGWGTYRRFCNKSSPSVGDLVDAARTKEDFMKETEFALAVEALSKFPQSWKPIGMEESFVMHYPNSPITRSHRVLNMSGRYDLLFKDPTTNQIILCDIKTVSNIRYAGFSDSGYPGCQPLQIGRRVYANNAHNKASYQLAQYADGLGKFCDVRVSQLCILYVDVHGEEARLVPIPYERVQVEYATGEPAMPLLYVPPLRKGSGRTKVANPYEMSPNRDRVYLCRKVKLPVA